MHLADYDSFITCCVSDENNKKPAIIPLHRNKSDSRIIDDLVQA